MISKIEKKLPSIDIVGASAGTGKTRRLVDEFLSAVQGTGSRQPIEPTRIIVCTFTNKAADELSARIRQRLIQEGHGDAAQLVLTSYVGTVNSISGRLLKDYALECGLSPHQDVIPEHMQDNLFAIASAAVLDSYAQRIEQIARRLSFSETTRKSRFHRRTHWMDHVRTICSLARANAMSAAALRISAARSWNEVQQHLGAVNTAIDADEMDSLIEAELERVVNEIDTSNDSTGKTAKELQNMRECYSRARNVGLTWRDWASLKKMEVGKESRAEVKDLLVACSMLTQHPRLHSDLQQYLTLIFDCAVDSLEAYQDYKKSAGLVDFVDQELLALGLLDVPSVRDALKARFDLVLIDEFQDTSPIQLALFLKLAELVNHSIWVGDVKQAIYGFRGTDPQLMQECAKLFNRQPPLEESHRSRPQLVHFANEVFRRVFPAYGITEAEVITMPSGKRAQADKHVIELWQCEGENLEGCFANLATAVKECLGGEHPHKIEDPHTGRLRPVRGSDIAILCRKNDHCSQLAACLADLGVKVAMTRTGLLDTAECLLTIAILRYLVEPSDKIALGYIMHLTQDYERADQSAWLSRWLETKYPDTLLTNKKQLEEARKSLPVCTLSEAVSLAITSGSVLQMIAGWGNVSYRLSNLDAFSGLVAEYEDTCALARTAATIHGFLMYLEQLEECEQPASIDPEAVQVLTYHRSKGLEWPVVILADLDAEATPKVHKDMCKIHVEGSDAGFDIDDPLRGRWVRFWPWPFGSIESDGGFEPSVARSPEFATRALKSQAENARLMYVGITRARDLLVFAPYTGRTRNKLGTQWLDELKIDGKPIMRLPVTVDDTSILVGESTHVTRVLNYNTPASETQVHQRLQGYWPATKPLTLEPPLPYILRPSSLTGKTISDSQDLTELFDIGERLQIQGKVDMALLGDCVHDFLAVDDCTLDESSRLELAGRIRKNWQIDQISNEQLLVMGDRLVEFLSKRFGTHTTFTECPVGARVGLQRLRGSMDLLVETTDAFHIIDHKTFPGPMDQWTDKAAGFAPQLYAYRMALSKATEKRVASLMIHLPVIGKVIDITKVADSYTLFS